MAEIAAVLRVKSKMPMAGAGSPRMRSMAIGSAHSSASKAPASSFAAADLYKVQLSTAENRNTTFDCIGNEVLIYCQRGRQ